MPPTNTLNEAAYKKTASTFSQARPSSPYSSNPRFGMSGSGDSQQLVAIAMAQVDALQDIKASIEKLHEQRKQQFDEEKKRQFDLFQTNNRRIQQAGVIGAAVARNDGVGVATGTANMAADALPGVLGKVAGSFGTVAAAASMLTSALLARSKELANYSGSITAAEAHADIRRMMADIREARALGDSYKKLINAQVELEMTVRENLIPIKAFLLETLAEFLKGLKEFLESEGVDKFGKGLSFLGNATMAGWNMITNDVDGMKKRFDKMDKNLEGIFNNTKKPTAVGDINDLLSPLLNVNRVDIDPRPSNPVGPIDPSRQMRVPLITDL